MSAVKHLLPLFGAAIVSVLVVCSYGWYDYRQDFTRSLTELDQKLVAASLAAEAIAGANLHQTILNESSLSLDESKHYADLLTEYANAQGLVYLYTMILDGNHIRFTSSSLTPEEIAGAPYEGYYWDVYDDADPIVFDVFKSGQAAFHNYSDKWGHFRSYFVAKDNAAGQRYVIGIDLGLDTLEKIKNNALRKVSVYVIIVLFLLFLWALTSQRLRERLLRANRRAELAHSVATIGVWEWDILKGDFFLTPNFLNALGYDNDFPGRNMLEKMGGITHPDDIEVLKEFVAKAMVAKGEEAGLYDYEFRLRNADGDYVWCRSQGNTVKWKRDNTPSMRVGVIENIDPLKRAQSQLEQAKSAAERREVFFRSLLENLPDLVSFKNSEGRYLFASSAFEDMFGIPVEQLLEHSDHDLLPFHIAEMLVENDQRALRAENPIRFEEWMIFASDDRPHLLETLKTPVLNTSRELLGVLSIGRDITQREELIGELEKFKRFAHFSEQGMCMASLAAEVRYLNPSFTALVTDEKKNLENLSLHTLFIPSERSLLEKEILPAVRNEGFWSGELTITHSNGLAIPVLSTFFTIFGEHHTPLFIGLIVSDISVRKTFERELAKAKTDAEVANESKSVFLANMSHEIRTPMNAILGYTQLILKDQLSHKHREQLTHILRAGQRLLDLINDILDLSKIEAGKIHLDSEVFDLHRELSDSLILFEERAASKNIELRNALSLPSPAAFRGDRRKIGQIVLNLISNAIKFTAEGSITLNATASRDGIYVRVSDTGVGISDEDKRKLFNPFTQGEEGRKSGGGTGLGLVLSRRMAEAMGGHLRLASAVGLGTLVELYLPGNLEKTELIDVGAQSVLHCAVDASQCKTIVIDDDPHSAAILAGLLSAFGADTQVFTNAEDALVYLQTHAPDIIFTDIRMPSMSGLEFRAYLATCDDFMNIPVVAVSASTLEHERSYFLAEGFRDFISKPVQEEEVVRVLLGLSTKVKQVTAEVVVNAVAELGAVEGISEQDLLYLHDLQESAVVGDLEGVRKYMAQFSEQFRQTGIYAELCKTAERYDYISLEKLLDNLLRKNKKK